LAFRVVHNCFSTDLGKRKKGGVNRKKKKGGREPSSPTNSAMVERTGKKEKWRMRKKKGELLTTYNDRDNLFLHFI